MGRFPFCLDSSHSCCLLLVEPYRKPLTRKMQFTGSQSQNQIALIRRATLELRVSIFMTIISQRWETLISHYVFHHVNSSDYRLLILSSVIFTKLLVTKCYFLPKLSQVAFNIERIQTPLQRSLFAYPLLTPLFLLYYDPVIISKPFYCCICEVF